MKKIASILILIFHFGMIFGDESQPQRPVKNFSEVPSIPDLLDMSDDCILDNNVYSDGQIFELNCRVKCLCQKGISTCSDNCPTISWPPDENCGLVRVSGRCCDEIRCDSDPKMQICGIPSQNSESAIEKYPWMILICGNEKCDKNFHGLFASEKHILTLSPDLKNRKQLKIILGKNKIDFSQPNDFQMIEISNITTHPEFQFGFSQKLQLLELRDSLNFDPSKFQTANLPLSKNQCSKLTSSNCAVTTIGWNLQNQSPEKMNFEEQISTFDTKNCDPSRFVVKHGKLFSNFKSKRTCIKGLKSADCKGSTGGVVVAAVDENINFVVGILDRNFETDAKSLISCEKQGTASVLPMCDYVDWIRTIAN